MQCKKFCKEGRIGVKKDGGGSSSAYVCLFCSSVYPFLIQQLFILIFLSHHKKQECQKKISVGMAFWKLLVLISRLFCDILASHSSGGSCVPCKATSTSFFRHRMSMQTRRRKRWRRRRRRQRLRNENVLYLATLTVVADFLFTRAVFIYLYILLTF
jgi:hypothetical protein